MHLDFLQKALLFTSLRSFTYAFVHKLPLELRDGRTGTGAVEYDPTIPSANIAPTQLKRDGWTASADSFQPGCEAYRVLDGTGDTWWESQYNPTLSALPHTITLDMKSPQSVTGFVYLPRQDGSNSGNIAQHRIETSLDGNTWKLVGSGTYRNDQARKTTLFSSTIARYVRLIAQSEAGGQQYVTVGEINVLSAPEPFLPRDSWRVSADSENPFINAHPATAAIDGATTTYWATQFDGSVPNFPHTFTIDQGSPLAVSGLAYFAQPADANGRIGQFNVQSSSDGNNWNTIVTGSWPDTPDPKYTQFAPVTARYFRLTALSEAGGRVNWCSAAEINLLDGRKTFADFTATADSQEVTVATEDGRAINALDGNRDTFWVTAWNTNSPPGYPHRFTIDMQTAFNVQGLSYTPRQDQSNGNIGQHTIEVSLDNQAWTKVASGSFKDDRSVKTANWVGISARYVRLNALSEAGGRGPWASAAEIHPIISSSYTPPALQGRWSSVIDFPLVPVAAALIPRTGQVLTWSAQAPDAYGQPGGKTFTATYDPSTGQVSQAVISNTNHDMFCPGISLATYGAIIVSGGENAAQTSIYGNGAWSAAAQLQTPRGYNSQVTLSNGGIFTIGGSWSGGEGGKDAEIYDPAQNTWSKLPGCPVAPMLTNDKQGIYRQDNHGWLFARSNASIFQAGPSSKMNWYTTGGGGSGGQSSAGNRASDPDSMNGNAVMYDAVAGKILAVGGAPSYDGSVATSNAHIITVGSSPGSQPTVQRIANMAYARAFHNGVILPTGQVVIIGGLSFARVFNDDTSILYPELFDPTTQSFTKLAPMTVPRNYHSVALLLPDGTVFSGGGGLCGQGCAVNHFDAQILQPPYLLDSAGNPAARPSISGTSPAVDIPVGSKFTVTTSGTVASFSILRFSSVTHSVNTDQRRVPLKVVGQSGNTYTLQTPGDSGVVVPGSWMLFAIDAMGVPSVGRIMYLY